MRAWCHPRARVTGDLADVRGLITVPRGWDTDERVIPNALIYLILRGGMRLVSGGRSWDLEPGACVLVPPGPAFRFSSPASASTILRSRLEFPGMAALPLTVCTGAWELEPVLLLLIDELSASRPHRDMRVRALAALLGTGLQRSASADTDGLDALQRRALAALVERHRGHGLTPRDLARELGLTLDYFTRRFRRAYGMPPRRWLVRDRIHDAARLLAESGAPLEAIAAQLGYQDLKLFGRQFRSVMGSPPGRWRAERQGAPV